MLMTDAVFLSGCAGVQNKEGTFYNIFVKPMDWLLHFFSDLFNGSYGLAIILITVLIRLVLMPLMLKNYKAQQAMKVKMDALRPEMEDIQKRIERSKRKRRQRRANEASARNDGALFEARRQSAEYGLSSISHPDANYHGALLCNSLFHRSKITSVPLVQI